MKFSIGRRHCFGAALGLALAAMAGPVFAQDYPDRTIRIIVPFAAGGGVGNIGTLLVNELAPALDADVVLEYIGGSGAMIGTYAAARAQSDGYTLLLGGAGSHTISPLTYANVPYDPVEDFEPVVRFGYTPYVLVAHNSLGVETLEEFLDLVRSSPGDFSYGSAGIGTINHLSTELLATRADLDIVHIPYQGSGPNVVDLLAGRLEFSMFPPSTVLQHIQEGTLVPLAISANVRSSALPDVPTFEEAAGFDLEATGWYGLFAPRGTDPEIVSFLNEKVNALLEGETFPVNLQNAGVEPNEIWTPEEFGNYVASELEIWSAVIEDAGVELMP